MYKKEIDYLYFNEDTKEVTFITYADTTQGKTRTPISSKYEINIYELAYKCKEWAFGKMFFLSSGFDTDGAFCLDRMNSKSFIAETEPEAIFKACQWILENKGKDD